MAAYAQLQGQDFIPVHIFPINYDQEKSREFLKKSSRDDPEYRAFTEKMKEVFNLFQARHQLPIVGINQGENTGFSEKQAVYNVFIVFSTFRNP